MSTSTALLDTASRFFCSVDSMISTERTMFLFEESHWFYLDNHVAHNGCKFLPFGIFIAEMLQVLPTEIFDHIFKIWSAGLGSERYTGDLPGMITRVCQDFLLFKRSIPVNGAIIFNKAMTKVLLVKGVSKKSSWTFPRGKVDTVGEPDHICASREVMEETGLDISKLIKPSSYLEIISPISPTLSPIVPTSLDSTGKSPSPSVFQKVKLFLVTLDQDEADIKLNPIAKNEISQIEWFSLEDLFKMRSSRSTGKASNTASNETLSPNKFFMVLPWLGKLYNYVCQNKVKKISKLIQKGKSQKFQQGKKADLATQKDSSKQQQQRLNSNSLQFENSLKQDQNCCSVTCEDDSSLTSTTCQIAQDYGFNPRTFSFNVSELLACF